MVTMPHMANIRLGPEFPLGRRGCRIESAKTFHDETGWSDTHFAVAAKDQNKRNEVIRLIKESGEEVFTILKRIRFPNPSNFNPSQLNDLKGTFDSLKILGILIENDVREFSLPGKKEDFGSEFECVVQIALENLLIQAKRDAKVVYPFSDRPYDPDGQKYDVLGGLDLSRLLWIECKKPMYINDTSKPLSNVISESKVKSFYRRCHFLRPSIAIFLVDTKEDYTSLLRSHFSPDFLASGCYVETASKLENVLVRINGFIYFARIQYKKPKEYFEGVKQSISQVLYDSRKEWPETAFNGTPFRS